MVGGAAPGGLIGWITQYGQVVYFFAQIAFWVILAVSSAWATLLFRKLVNAKVAAISAGLPSTPVEAEKAVSVEEFVE